MLILKTRVITAIVGLAIFIPLILIGHLPLQLAAIVLGIVAMSEILIMKKMFLTSFAAIMSYIGVLIITMPKSWLSWLPSHFNRLTTFYVIVILILLHTVVHKGQCSSINTNSLYATCQSIKLLSLCSPLVRINSSGSLYGASLALIIC